MSHYDVRLENLESIALAVVRRQVTRAELGQSVQDGCGRAWAFAKRLNLQAGNNVAVYWDGSICLESGVIVGTPFEEQEGITRSATPAGPTAFVTHIGPYSQLGMGHEAIVKWCSARGHRLAGPNWEIYGHWQSEWNNSSSLIRTDVFYQVVP
jgi:effector-binding domain-containing protein